MCRCARRRGAPFRTGKVHVGEACAWCVADDAHREHHGDGQSDTSPSGRTAGPSGGVFEAACTSRKERRHGGGMGRLRGAPGGLIDGLHRGGSGGWSGGGGTGGSGLDGDVLDGDVLDGGGPAAAGRRRRAQWRRTRRRISRQRCGLRRAKAAGRRPGEAGPRRPRGGRTHRPSTEWLG